MKRRGPDDSGSYADGDCTLLHARLAVIDITGGKQPMGVTWAGEQYEIVYNGELYNTQELRRELMDLGHRFLGHSDTGWCCTAMPNGVESVWKNSMGYLLLPCGR